MKREDLKVFISTRDSSCGECGEDLGRKARFGWLLWPMFAKGRQSMIHFWQAAMRGGMHVIR